MKSVKFLDQAIEKHGLKNDLALAKKLGWSSGKISQYRSAKRFMDNEACVALALCLECDPLPIIMAADMDRAERAGQHSLWEVFTQRMAIAGSALLVVNLFLTPTPSEAAPVLKPVSATICLMSNR
jgi:hypothetical protein